MIKRKKYFLNLILIGLLLPFPLFAQSEIKPFGGIIVSSIPCICSLTRLLILKPVDKALPRFVVYDPLPYPPFPPSILYEFYQIFRPGPYVLGIAEGTRECTMLFFVPEPVCVTVARQPRIKMVGTSLY